MAIELTISNVLQLFSFISPILLAFFLVMTSLFNQNLKGLVYLSGALMSAIVNVFLMNQIQSESDPDAAFSCNMFDIPFVSKFNSPSSSSLFIAFTIAYLVIPMGVNNQLNYPVLAMLLCLLGVDILTKIQNKCTNYAGATLGALVGFFLGTIWYSLFHITGYDSLLYFDELRSDKVMCAKPTKQTFKCSVYKNGELVSSNIA
jgi:hypothetical protein